MTATRTTVETKRVTLREAAERMAAAIASAIKLSDKHLPFSGRTRECQRVYDKNAAALANYRAALAAEADKDKGEER